MKEQNLPEGWQVVKFSDIAKHISKRVEPSETDLEVYVGLEHLEPDSLKIKCHGVPSDVAGQKLLVKKGQIIFGKRRAYQRKVAVANWDCICSAHAMVLEAISDKVIPDYLPFFMQSDAFMKRAIAISEGSLSPTIKWKVLAQQNFSLPSKEQQETLLRLYNGVLRARDKCENAMDSFNRLFTVFLSKNLGGNFGNELTIDDIATVVRGSSPRPKGDPRYYGGTIPRLMVEDIVRDGKYVTACIDYLTEEGAKKSRLKQKGTLVMVCSGTPATVGNPAILNIDACIHDGIISLDNINEEIVRTEYLYYLMVLNQRQSFNLATHGGTFVNLTTSIVKKMRFSFPPLEYQDKAIELCKQFETTQRNLEYKRAAIKELGNSIV
ncbi:restriction endonuclease subunit S [Aliivibrio fischeri]|uniref:restriction endonuclease subunit S n=1 Tax=Aliivibrio fischeri TaxID=668 RepID=UPI0012DAAC48|nr:restriction endonuclease subunit S [Aliivibrio fischeri]MUJ22947.1 restriction endonuclease subunit S [Aliivibrio fischeri]